MSGITLTTQQAEHVFKLLEYNKHACEQYTKHSEDMRIIEHYLTEWKSTTNLMKSIRDQLKKVSHETQAKG